MLRDTLAIYKLKWCPIRTWHGIELPLSLLVAFVDFSCFLTLTFQKKKKLYFFYTLLFISTCRLACIGDWFDAGESCYATLTSHVTTTQHCLAREFHCCCSISHPWKYSPSFSGHFPFKVLCKNHCELSGSTSYIAT